MKTKEKEEKQKTKTCFIKCPHVLALWKYVQQKEQMRYDYKFSEGGNISEHKMGRAWITACTCDKLGIIPHSCIMWQHTKESSVKRCRYDWIRWASTVSGSACIHAFLMSRTTIFTRSLLVLLAVFTQCSHLDISYMADLGHKTIYHSVYLHRVQMLYMRLHITLLVFLSHVWII